MGCFHLYFLRLEHLYINNNSISKLFFTDCDFKNRSQLFPKLKSLSLNQNKIDDVRQFKFKLS